MRAFESAVYNEHQENENLLPEVQAEVFLFLLVQKYREP